MNSSRSRGDTVGEAFWINDNGVAVGTTGHCSDTQLPPFAGGAHAVLWDKYGTPHDLGGFGGKANPAVRGHWEHCFRRQQSQSCGRGRRFAPAT